MYALSVELPNPRDFKDLFQTLPPPKPSKAAPKKSDITATPHLYRALNFQSTLDQDSLPPCRSTTLCLLFLPASIPDFLHYLSSLASDFIEECLESLQSIQSISSIRGFSTALLHFSSQSSADHFYLIFNGREFHEGSSEFCYIVFISSVISSSSVLDYEHIELPLCPLCIERIDVNISGISGVLKTEISNLQQSRWIIETRTCELCKILNEKPKEISIKCESCEEINEIWVCLTCGNVGCGRYKEAHGEKHYETTGHNFTVEVSSQCIWDYKRDHYVHRMINSGKGVIVLDTQFSQIPKENIAKLVNEYNYLINSQLERQRIMYEQRIESALASKNEMVHEKIKNAKAENEILKGKFAKIKTQKKRKESKIVQLKTLKEENAILIEVNKSLKEYENDPSDMPVFEDKKSKGIYLKLQRLRSELNSLMGGLN